MNDKIEVSCNQGFKSDVKRHAEKRGMSMAEYMREAARREMQRDMVNNE